MYFLCCIAALGLITYWICDWMLKTTGWKDGQARKAAMAYIITKSIGK